MAPLRVIRILGPWSRLHRAESDILASLLSADERAAVNRRLGLPAPGTRAWVPIDAGDTGGRFAEPHGPGALYLGRDLATCLAELAHHHALRCAASIGTPPGARAVFRHLLFQVSGPMADAAAERRAGLHDPSGYGPSWGYARLARTAGLDGVHYRSVRKRGGRCLAVFHNRAARFSHVEYGAVVLEWDGTVARRIA
jgi:hypothetical protein